MHRQFLDLLELANGRDFPTPQTLNLDLKKDLRAEAARLLPEGPEYIGLAPGSGGPPKFWPLENFIELARHLEFQGRVPVFFLGPKETRWIDEIRNALPETRFPLQEE
jgi:ADP-heptose:LPS heptosyltransferase